MSRHLRVPERWRVRCERRGNARTTSTAQLHGSLAEAPATMPASSRRRQMRHRARQVRPPEGGPAGAADLARRQHAPETSFCPEIRLHHPAGFRPGTKVRSLGRQHTSRTTERPRKTTSRVFGVPQRDQPDPGNQHDSDRRPDPSSRPDPGDQCDPGSQPDRSGQPDRGDQGQARPRTWGSPRPGRVPRGARRSELTEPPHPPLRRLTSAQARSGPRAAGAGRGRQGPGRVASGQDGWRAAGIGSERPSGPKQSSAEAGAVTVTGSSGATRTWAATRTPSVPAADRT